MEEEAIPRLQSPSRPTMPMSIHRHYSRSRRRVRCRRHRSRSACSSTLSLRSRSGSLRLTRCNPATDSHTRSGSPSTSLCSRSAFRLLPRIRSQPAARHRPGTGWVLLAGWVLPVGLVLLAAWVPPARPVPQTWWRQVESVQQGSEGSVPQAKPASARAPARCAYGACAGHGGRPPRVCCELGVRPCADGPRIGLHAPLQDASPARREPMRQRLGAAGQLL